MQTPQDAMARGTATRRAARSAAGAGLAARLAACAASALLSAAAGAQSAGSEAGAWADSSIWSTFVICSTCDTPTELESEQSHGGLGRRLAIVGGFANRGEGTAETSARAIVHHSTALPQLEASARADPGLGSHPDFSADGAYFFSPTASARVAQFITYGGAATSDYSFRFHLSGSLAVTLPNPTDSDEAAISGSGGLALYDDRENNLELPFGQQIDIVQISFNGGAGTVRQTSRELSITLQPGASFYLLGFVAANVANGYGYANMGSTLDV